MRPSACPVTMMAVCERTFQRSMWCLATDSQCCEFATTKYSLRLRSRMLLPRLWQRISTPSPMFSKSPRYNKVKNELVCFFQTSSFQDEFRCGSRMGSGVYNQNFRYEAIPRVLKFKRVGRPSELSMTVMWVSFGPGSYARLRLPSISLPAD